MSYASYMDWILYSAPEVLAHAKKVLKILLLRSDAILWQKTEIVFSSMSHAARPHWFKQNWKKAAARSVPLSASELCNAHAESTVAQYEPVYKWHQFWLTGASRKEILGQGLCGSEKVGQRGPRGGGSWAKENSNVFVKVKKGWKNEVSFLSANCTPAVLGT